VLVAGAYPAGSYALVDAVARLSALKVRSFPVEPTHAIKRINPSEKDPSSRKCDLVVEPGRALKGRVLGPDGKPLAGAHVAGLGSPRYHFGAPEARPRSEGLKGPDFAVQSLGGKQTRALVFYHPGKKLGKVVRVKGSQRPPFEVRLGPTGAVAGRVLDSGGKPWAGLTVTAELTRRITDYKDLPWTDLLVSGMAEVMAVKATTDDSGRFRLEGLLPGLVYNLVVTDGEDRRRAAIAYHARRLPVAAGKTHDLGDLKSKIAPAKGKKDR
jgi:hypothetical protein